MNLLLPVMTINNDTVPEKKHLGRKIEPACMCLYVPVCLHSYDSQFQNVHMASFGQVSSLFSLCQSVFSLQVKYVDVVNSFIHVKM